MVKKIKNKNLLPLLAVTALMLSVGLIRFNGFSNSSTTSTQMVLSKSDENIVNDSQKSNGSGSSSSEVRVEAKRVEEIRKSPEASVKRTDKPEKVEVSAVASPETESEIESEFEHITTVSSTNEASTIFKLKIQPKEIKGKTVVDTPNGEKTVEMNPEDVANDLVKDSIIDVPVAVDTSIINDKINFEVKGVENKKLFGLFNIELPKVATVDSNTGKVTETKQGFWTRVLDFLSK